MSDSMGVPFHALRDSYIGGVTIIHLVADPEEYVGRLVQAEGFFRYRFEDVSLGLSNLEGLNSPSLAVWVSFADECTVRRYEPDVVLPCTDETVGALDGKRVRLVGRFDRSGHGHMGMYFGQIGEVTRILEY